MMKAGLLTVMMKILTSSFYESEEYFHILHFGEVNCFQRLFYLIRFYRSFATASHTLQNIEINIFNSISSETVLRGLRMKGLKKIIYFLINAIVSDTTNQETVLLIL